MEISISIESLAFGGAGVGRLPDGRVCFVPLTLPGEKALVRVVREKKSFVEAEVVRLTEVSLMRVPARCPIFGQCGGCAYQHVAYPRQLEIKREQIQELVRRVGGLEGTDVRPTLPSPDEWEYRNRISVHVEDGRVGFHGRKSHRIVPAAACAIATPDLNAQLARLAARPPRGNQRITLRESTDYHGFSQVNAGAAGVLAAAVSSMFADKGPLLVDAYCGAGFFAKKLSPRFAKIVGIEWSPGAVKAAREGASEKETYLEGAVEVHLGEVLESHPADGASVLLDPPAEGLSPEVVDILLRHRPETIVYVSCDPSTLSRDVKKLAASYAVDHIQPVDMFPQTAEIESVTKLKRL